MFRHLIANFRAVRWKRNGTAAMEFAAVASVMAVCVTSGYDLGNLIYQKIRLGEAVRAAGVYAQIPLSVDWSNSTSVTAFQTAVAAKATAAVSDWTNVTVGTPTITCKCWTQSTNAYVSGSCSSDCSSPAVAASYVSITATRPFSALFLVGLNTTLTATHVVRFQ